MMAIRRALVAALLALSWVQAPVAAQEPLEALQQAVAGLPPGFLDLSEIDVFTGSDGITTVAAKTTLGNAKTDVLVAMTRGAAPGAKRGFVLALRPERWSITEAVPQLANPALDGLTFENIALVVTNDSATRTSAEMGEAERAFFANVFHSDTFALTLRPGLNLLAGIPAEGLEPGHPLIVVMDALGIEKGVIFLQGSLGKSLTMLATPGGGMAAIKDLYLRAELPPMRPPNSPEWFLGGQLALELTGDPSVRFVGEMSVQVQDDSLMFFLAAALARTGVSLAGGLVAERGWDAPFGIAWVTLNKVILKIGITPAGSVQLGFAGDVVIGEKDMAVAIAVAISPAGAPTNFIFDGSSQAGFGLSDLVMVQEKMAAARQAAASAAGGGPGPTAAVRLPIDALPQIEFRDVALKFAPKPEPDLGVERGMAIKGRLWLAPPNGALTDFAAVDVNVGEDGLWVRGDIGALTLGPLALDDAKLDITMTPEEQRFLVKGAATLFSVRQELDVELDRTQLRFFTRTQMFNLFTATLNAQAAFDLRQPSFLVEGVAESDLESVVGPVVQHGALQFARGGAVVVSEAEATVTALRQTLSNAEATVDQLRATLEQQRALAQSRVTTAQSAAQRALTAANTARARRAAAYAQWAGTSSWYAAYKASLYAAYVAAHVNYTVLSATYAATSAAATTAQRVLDALPPVDQNLLLMAADDAARILRQRLETAAVNLEALSAQIDALIALAESGNPVLVIDRAAFRAQLASVTAGGALSWNLVGSFAQQPFDITSTIDFSNLHTGGAQLLTALLQR
jgi:hypothetical protein